MIYNKSGSNKHIRRIHHSERIIQNRANLAYVLGYSPQCGGWVPYKKCNKEKEHRLYIALGIRCPCEKSYFSNYTREKNKPTNILFDHRSCSCLNCKGHKRKWKGNSKKALPIQERKALLDCEERIQQYRERLC